MDFDTSDSVATQPHTALLKRFFSFDIPKPQAADVKKYFGKRGTNETNEFCEAAASARADMVSATGSSDHAAIVGTAKGYLPYILRIHATEEKIDGDGESKESPPTVKFTWTSNLDNAGRSGRWTRTGAYFDLLFTLNLLGTSLCSMANTLAKDDVVPAAKHLSEAAGVFEAAAEFATEFKHKTLTGKQPQEMFAGIYRGLAKSCQAQAQQCATYKAEGDGKAKSLLAKLTKGAADLHREALSEIQNGLTTERFGLMDPVTMETMTVLVDALNATACKFAAVAAYGADKFGEAIVQGNRAKATLSHMLRGITNPLLRKIVTTEVDWVSRTLEQYELENRTIYFEAVPADSAVPRPTGLTFSKIKPFEIEADWRMPLELVDPEDEAEAARVEAMLAAADSRGAGGATGTANAAAPDAVGGAADMSRPEGITEDVYVDAKPPAKPAGAKQMQFGCSKCGQKMSAPAGSPQVQCPKCKSINVNISCGACDSSVSCIKGTKLVRCPTCSIINRLS